VEFEASDRSGAREGATTRTRLWRALTDSRPGKPTSARLIELDIVRRSEESPTGPNPARTGMRRLLSEEALYSYKNAVPSKGCADLS
jgi:hypothetical protein